MKQIAVLGAGTMGGGVAQAALAAGCAVVLYDISEAALARAHQRIAAGLVKQGAAEALGQLRCVSMIEQISGAQLVVEAAPERLELKQSLLRQAAEHCPPPAIIASNTSSLPIAALAMVCSAPERVAGLHFFNPVHRMALVELVRTPQTDDATVAVLVAFSAQIGKTAVLARDTPGFIVNRVARPFYGEGLRLLGEGSASIEAIDTLLEASGFPLGPFALMDLIGIDVNMAVTQSVYDQMFHEPRFRPHPIQQQMVLQGHLGRKTGRGFYDYVGGGQRAAFPAGDTGGQHNSSVLLTAGSWSPGLHGLLSAAGLTVISDMSAPLPHDLRAAFVVAGRAEGSAALVAELDRLLDPTLPIFAQALDCTICELASGLTHPERIIGFDGLFTDGALTLAASPMLSKPTRASAAAFVQGLGRSPMWVADSPALVVARVVAMLANEAAFALGEGVADAAAIDTAMRLGTNHPVGPLLRAAELGYAHVVTILDHLWSEFHEERYRVAPILRRAARLGVLA